jgi:hypothetical protein
MLIDLSVEERQRLADAVKHHQRDRNRAPSEPAGWSAFVCEGWKRADDQ